MERVEAFLNLVGYKIIHTERDLDEKNHQSIFVHCEPEVPRARCPLCGSQIAHVKDHLTRTVQDFDSGGQHVYLIVHITRYQCQNKTSKRICGKTYTDDLQMIDCRARMTQRYRDYIVSKALSYPFLRVANECSISDMTVRRALDSWSDEREEWRLQNLYCPSSIGIDENHISGQFCLVITDNEHHTLLEIMDNKDPETVRIVLEQLKEKGIPQSVTMDMCLEYRSAVYEVFGQHSAIVVDHFHVVKLILEAMMEIRKNLIAENEDSPIAGLKYNAMKLKTNLEDLTDEDKRTLARLFKAVPGLLTAYKLKESLRSIWCCKSREDAEMGFNKVTEAIPEDEAFEPYRRVIRTMNQWKPEIFNFFEYEGVSNGFTECVNGLISRRNLNGNGYSFKMIRILSLYGKGSIAFHPDQEEKITNTAISNDKPQIVEETENEDTVKGQLRYNI